MKISFVIPDSYQHIRKGAIFNRKIRVHYLRDWSGFEVPGYLLFQPLDAMYGASYARSQNQEVQLMDGNLKHCSHQKIINKIKVFYPDWLVLSASWRSLASDIEFIKEVKGYIPDLRVAMAGPNVTWNPGLVLYPGSVVDLVILGEIEGGLRGLLAGNLEDNCSFLDSNGKVKNGRRTLIENLDQLPFPARDLLPKELYNIPFSPKNPVTSMQISRGCPHSKCRFCNGNMYSMGSYRCRSPENVLAEIDEVVNYYKIPGINFRDQCFSGNQDMVAEICRGIINNSWKISWRASTRVDCVSKELLQLMAKAGCYQISFGFETDDQEVLNAIGKGITVAQAKRAAQWAKTAGMELSGGLMLSLHKGEQQASRRLLSYAKELKLDYPQFQLTTIVPGAPLYREKRMNEEGSKTCNFFSFNTAEASEKIMLKKLAGLYLKFYFRPGYIFNRLKKIKSGRQLWQTAKTAFKVFSYPFLYKI